MPKSVARPLKRVSLVLGEMAVIPLGFFLSFKLTEYLGSGGSIPEYVLLVSFLGGPLLTLVCLVLLLRGTRAWRFAYDVQGWRIERDDRQQHPRRWKWKREARRVSIWVPSAIAAFVLFFYPVATHVIFPTAGHLGHYRVSLPLNWTILPRIVRGTARDRERVPEFWKGGTVWLLERNAGLWIRHVREPHMGKPVCVP